MEKEATEETMGENLEMEFRYGHVRIILVRLDDGMYVIRRSYTDREGTVCVGTVDSRENALYLFENEVYVLTRRWKWEGV